MGNSLGVRIPKSVAKEAGIGPGVSVRVSAQKGCIVLEPVRYELDSLIDGITAENRHEATKTGSPVGSEA
jgi:antitoxin MazE